ncbi:hypothetical protein RJT34_29421 [Clitoria ternatea]|uniref:Uncharacterized protein n=1 Tax=Clitoria ternatea TaxID=43366 RepID=A0AAN9FC57_CLITE
MYDSELSRWKILDSEMSPSEMFDSELSHSDIIDSEMSHLNAFDSAVSHSKTWDLYEQKELIGLVDTSLNGEFDAQQASNFLKIGLLCTQESPKLRPSMSSVVKMLTGRMDVDDSKITKPALISDFLDPKVRRKKESSTYNTSSASENQDTTWPFTSQYDQTMQTSSVNSALSFD